MTSRSRYADYVMKSSGKKVLLNRTVPLNKKGGGGGGELCIMKSGRVLSNCPFLSHNLLEPQPVESSKHFSCFLFHLKRNVNSLELWAKEKKIDNVV